MQYDLQFSYFKISMYYSRNNTDAKFNIHDSERSTVAFGNSKHRGFMQKDLSL